MICTVQRIREVTEYVASAYSHILYGKGTVTGASFANEIRDSYLMTEDRHRVSAEFAEKYIESIAYNPCGGVQVKFDFSTL